MEINSILQDYLKNNNDLITTKETTDLGFSKSLLSVYVKNGLLERKSQGVYSLPDSIDDDMYLLMLHSKNIVFSHDSALFLNKLSDRTPFVHSITIPSNSSLQKSIRDECNCYYIKPDLHSLGLISRYTTFGNEVQCYNEERTICDLLRSRSRVDEEIIISALKNYVLSPDKNLNQLADYSEKFNVKKLVRNYMEVLL